MPVETSLHRDLKRFYAGPDGAVEAQQGPYRIDAVRGELLIEIQHSGLAAIRDKIRALLTRSRVLVVKPIIASKLIEKLACEDGPLISARRSPKRGTALDLFCELVHFTSVFPHERLSIETPMVEIAEVRYPGHGRRRRRRQTDFQIADQRLLAIVETHCYRSAADLLSVLPAALPAPFDTCQLASALSIDRGAAQRIAYCLRTSGATRPAGKRGNTVLYELATDRVATTSSRQRSDLRISRGARAEPGRGHQHHSGPCRRS